MVRSLREVLEKRGGKKTSQLELSEICFKVNCITQPSGQGSAAERFLKRKPKSLLPASMDDHIDHQEMIKKRHDLKLAISRKKGRASVDQFEEGDKVIIRSPDSGKWLETGTIQKKRVAEDNTNHSFEIMMDDGSVKLRNKCFIKHASKGPARSVDINPDSVEHVYDAGNPVQTLSDSAVEQPVLYADQGESRPRTRARARQLTSSPQ